MLGSAQIKEEIDKPKADRQAAAGRQAEGRPNLQYGQLPQLKRATEEGGGRGDGAQQKNKLLRTRGGCRGIC